MLQMLEGRQNDNFVIHVLLLIVRHLLHVDVGSPVTLAHRFVAVKRQVQVGDLQVRFPGKQVVDDTLQFASYLRLCSENIWFISIFLPHFFFQILKIWEKKCFHWQKVFNLFGLFILNQSLINKLTF